MNDMVLKTCVAVQGKTYEVAEKIKAKVTESRIDEGSFLTENLGVIAITVALVAIVMFGMVFILTGTATGDGDTVTAGSVLGTMKSRITAFFTGA